MMIVLENKDWDKLIDIIFGMFLIIKLFFELIIDNIILVNYRNGDIGGL